MTRHTATLLIERDKLFVRFDCDGDSDSECQQIPVGECYCEQYSVEKAEGKWGHRSQYWDEDADEAPWHPMRAGSTCNYIEFLTADASAEELYCGETMTFNDTEIEFIWDGDGYEWQAKK